MGITRLYVTLSIFILLFFNGKQQQRKTKGRNSKQDRRLQRSSVTMPRRASSSLAPTPSSCNSTATGQRIGWIVLVGVLAGVWNIAFLGSYLRLPTPVFDYYDSYQGAGPPVVAVGSSAVVVVSGDPNNTNTHAVCAAVLDRFDRVFDEKRTIRQDRVRASRVTEQEDPALRGGVAPQRTFLDKYEPEANCFTEERFGFKFEAVSRKDRHLAKNFYDQGFRYDSFGDGPKFVCGVNIIRSSHSNSTNSNTEHREPCLVYSVGSNNLIEFEMAVHKLLGCETHTFDPTIRTFFGNDFATFHRWGLGIDGEKTQHWEGKSFETVIRALGHENRTIDILKIDCEGCEWTTLPPLLDAIAAGRTRVHQIQVELHAATRQSASTPETRDAFFDTLDRAGMRIFHKERNHWGCDGWKCVEYSFVSEEFLRTANRDAVCGSESTLPFLQH